MPHKKKVFLIQPVKPSCKMFGIPIWFHPHGTKVTVTRTSNNNVHLGANTASIHIHSMCGGPFWHVDYTVIHGVNIRVSGFLQMTTSDLKIAFGIKDKCPAYGGQHLIDEFGGEVAQQGKFIRWGEYLNIPGPGTGHDGDANISIRVDDEIKEAVRTLLSK